MIIRSQDKGKIINFNLATDLVVSKNRQDKYDILVCYSYYTESDCGYEPIGTYSTGERAIKVLNMIQDHYCVMKSSDNVFTGTAFESLRVRDIRCVNLIADEHKHLYVFQMPQDSEV